MTTEPVFQYSSRDGSIDSLEGELDRKIRLYDRKALDLEKETGEPRTLCASERDDKPEKLTAEEPFASLRRDISVYRIKDINRLITRKISPKVKQDLTEERNLLARKKFGDGLSNKEERRLAYVRWQLDRIDDAEDGEMLDYLDKVADEHEKFAKEISTFLNKL